MKRIITKEAKLGKFAIIRAIRIKKFSLIARYSLLVPLVSICCLLFASSAFADGTVYKETSIVKRGSSAFRIELDTTATFNVLVTTNVKVTVKVCRYMGTSYSYRDPDIRRSD